MLHTVYKVTIKYLWQKLLIPLPPPSYDGGDITHYLSIDYYFYFICAIICFLEKFKRVKLLYKCELLSSFYFVILSMNYFDSMRLFASYTHSHICTILHMAMYLEICIYCV